MNAIEKVGVLVAALAIVGGIIWYTVSGSSAFTLPLLPAGVSKIYVATSGNDRYDGKTPKTAVRSLRRAVESKSLTIVLVGETYVLPRKVEHLQASQGIPLDHSVVITSNQTPWGGAPSSAVGGYTTIVPSGTYQYVKLYDKSAEGSVLFASKFIKFHDSILWLDSIDSVRVISS